MKMEIELKDFFNQTDCKLYYLIANSSEYSQSDFLKNNYSTFNIAQNNSEENFKKIIDEFYQKDEECGLFVICEDPTLEKWINFNIIRSDTREISNIFLSSPESGKAEINQIKRIIRKFVLTCLKSKYEQIDSNSIKWNISINEKEDPINCLKKILETLQSGSLDNLTSMKEELEKNLDQQITVKGMLKQVIEIFSEILNKAINYLPTEERLKCFSDVLISENFPYEPDNGDKTCLKLEVIKLLCKLKNRGVEFNEHIHSNIEIYLKREIDKCKKRINSYHSESNTPNYTFEDLIISEYEFLIYLNQLVPETLTIAIIDDFLNASSKLPKSIKIKKISEELHILQEHKIHRYIIDAPKNPYNQGIGYWYDSDDINRISRLFLQELSDDFDIETNMDIDQLRVFISDLKSTIFKPKLIPLNLNSSHWVALAIVPYNGKNIILYKDSLFQEDYKQSVQQLFNELLPNSEFKANEQHDSKQTDYSSCGSFTLCNLKVMAQRLKNGKDNFIAGFNDFPEFVTQVKVNEYRDHLFPQLYAKYMWANNRRKLVVSHHKNELELLQNELQKEGILDSSGPDIALSIRVPESELFIGNTYEYFYRATTRQDKFPDSFSEKLAKLLKVKLEKAEGNFHNIPYGVLKLGRQDLLVNNHITDEELTALLKDLGIEDNDIQRKLLQVNLSSTDIKELITEKNEILSKINLTKYPYLGRSDTFIEYKTNKNRSALSEIKEQQNHSIEKMISLLAEKDFENQVISGGDLKKLDQRKPIISQETLNYIAQISCHTESQKTKVDVAKILSNHNVDITSINEVTLKMFCNKGLPELDKNSKKLILNFLQKVHKIIPDLFKSTPKFADHIYQILLDDDLSDDDIKLLTYFPSVDLPKHIIDLIELEKIVNIGENLTIEAINAYKEYLDKGKKLIQKHFNRLANNLNIEIDGITEIIKIIIYNYRQEIPKSFIDAYKEFFLKLSEEKKLFEVKKENSICRMLLQNGSINLEEINFWQLISTEVKISESLLDLVRLEIKRDNIKIIPEHIVEKIKNQANSDKYSAFILGLLETDNSISIIMNANNYIRLREEKLKNTITGDPKNLKKEVSILKTLITSDPSMKKTAFVKLLEILPKRSEKSISEYLIVNFCELPGCLPENSKEIIKDLIEVVKCLEDLDCNDAKKLIGLDPSIDSKIFSLLSFNQSSLTEIEYTKLLKELSSSANGKKLVNANLKALTRIALLTFSSEIRKNVIDILDKADQKELEREENNIVIVFQMGDTFKGVKDNISVHLENLRELLNLDLDKLESIEILERKIQNGYTMTENQVNLLIENVIKYVDFNTNPNIINVLISCVEDIDKAKYSDLIDKFAKKLGSNPNIINLFHAMQKVCSELKVKAEALEKIVEFLKKVNNAIEYRLKAVEVIDAQINNRNIDDNSINTLKAVALVEPRTDGNILLHNIILEILNKAIKLGKAKLAKEFFENYSDILIDYLEEKLKPDKNLYRECIEKIKEFINDSNQDVREKHFLLQSLNNALCASEEEVKNILISISTLPDIQSANRISLSNMLLNNVSLNHDVSETEIELYDDNIYELNKLIESSPNNNIPSILSILEKLIEANDIESITFTEINNILILLKKGLEKQDEKTIKALQNLKDGVRIICQNFEDGEKNLLSELYKEFILNKFNITVEQELSGSIEKFCLAISDYNLLDIEKLIDNIKNNAKNYITNNVTDQKLVEKVYKEAKYKIINDLIQFFDNLNSIGLSHRIKQEFISGACENTTDMHGLAYNFYGRYTMDLLLKKFPQYRKNTRNNIPNLSVNPNAYNQAYNPFYWYSYLDLALISTELMKKFSNDFTLTPPLGNDSEMVLSEVLSKIIQEYKKSHNTILMPINVGGNHWVSIAVVRQGDKDVVLYKDLLANSNYSDAIRKEFIKSDLLPDAEFKVNSHETSKQKNSSSCGIFALANLKHMAEKLKNDPNNFIDQFEDYEGFITQNDADKMREEDFPKLYSLAACGFDKIRYILKQHNSELESIKARLVNDRNIGLKVVTAGEELESSEPYLMLSSHAVDNNFANDKYKYLYRIDAKGLELDEKLKKNITNSLGNPELKFDKENTIEILEQVLTNKILGLEFKKPKVDPSSLKPSEYLSETQLEYLCLNLGTSNIEKLKKDLGFQLSEAEQKKLQEIEGIKESSWLKGLHHKLTRMLASDSMSNQSGLSIYFINKIINRLDSAIKIEEFSISLDTIYEYQLKENDINDKGKNLIDIFNGNGNWAKEVHELAIQKTLNTSSKEKSVAQLKQEIIELNKDNNIGYLETDLEEEYKKIISSKEGVSIFTEIFLEDANDIVDNALKFLQNDKIKEAEEQLEKFYHIIKEEKIFVGFKLDENKRKDAIEFYNTVVKESSINDQTKSNPQDQKTKQLNLKAVSDQFKKSLIDGVGKIAIKDWTKIEVRAWAEQVKKDPAKANNYEKIAVMARAVEIATEANKKKISPREVQMLSVLILLNNKEGTGRLTQINTGEGKTTIVAMLAALKALEHSFHQVDIITSSSELAKPQSEEQRGFFQLFGFTCSHNGHDSSVDIKDRYKDNIVYGAAGDFQGDILRDEYSKLGTRNGRQCNIAIVDEVDSMLIDGRNHIVMLSSSMPAMDYLEHILAAIWTQVGIAADSILEHEGKLYYVIQDRKKDSEGNLTEEVEYSHTLIEGKTKKEVLQEVTEIYLRKALRGDLTKESEVKALADELERMYKRLNIHKTENDIQKEVDELKKQDFAFKIFEEKLKINKESNETPPDCYPKLEIPSHLRELVIKVQLPKWIDSAIYAMFSCHDERDYILKDGKIVPVDARNTGVEQGNMIWSDGLHQFLQIKHGAKIIPESLTTNLISNVAFFKRYNKNIYGLTGTLGSEDSKQLLNKTYKVDNIIIPPFKVKRYKELEPIATNDQETWYTNIAESCLNKLKNGRGTLVITKYIEEVDKIKEILEEQYGYDPDKVKVYKTSDM